MPTARPRKLSAVFEAKPRRGSNEPPNPAQREQQTTKQRRLRSQRRSRRRPAARSPHRSVPSPRRSPPIRRRRTLTPAILARGCASHGASSVAASARAALSWRRSHSRMCCGPAFFSHCPIFRFQSVSVRVSVNSVSVVRSFGISSQLCVVEYRPAATLRASY